MNHKHSFIYVMSTLLVFILILGCGSTTSPNNTSSQEEKSTSQELYDNSYKTWKSVDIAADAAMKILGELYKDGKLSETQKTIAVVAGNSVKESLATGKDALELYGELMENGKDDESAQKKLLDTLVILMKGFDTFKDEAEMLYKKATGKDLKLPEIQKFSALIQLLG